MCLFSQNLEKRILAACLSVRVSVHIEQLVPDWADCHEILYSTVFRKIRREIFIIAPYILI